MTTAGKYGWRGWKMPLLHPGDPDYCEIGCPICVAARRGDKVARLFQRIELIVTLGGCWWGRARRRAYGVSPDQPRPSK